MRNTSASLKGEKSIYDIIAHKIDVPEGLQFRGKYCAKSKIREDTMNYQNEFGRITDSDLRNSVTIKRRPKSSHNTTGKKNKSKMASEVFQRYTKAKDSKTIRTNGTEDT